MFKDLSSCDREGLNRPLSEIRVLTFLVIKKNTYNEALQGDCLFFVNTPSRGRSR